MDHVEVQKYDLPPTRLIPNSKRPLLHYPGLLAEKTDDCKPASVYDLFDSNGWKVQWIYRYGQTQESHYHSQAHECMAVLSGEATIRFGVADTVKDLDESTYGNGREEGGIEVHAKAGDVFVIPAGVAHKTYDTLPKDSFALMTPGDGHHPLEGDAQAALRAIELTGFCMIGAYPSDGEWDFAVGGDSEGRYEQVWSVPKPARDPVLGTDTKGLVGMWS